MRISTVLAALAAAALGSYPARADVWKVAVGDAKRDVHYLVNTGSRTVAIVQYQQCTHRFPARLVTDASGQVTGAVLETDLEGGQGGRGFQRIEFTLREGAAPLVVSNSYLGTRPPLVALATVVCRGSGCAEASCP
jgi:hypothetical protein